MYRGTSTTILSMRPDRPLPEELARIVGAVLAGEAPPGVQVLGSHGPVRPILWSLVASAAGSAPVVAVMALGGPLTLPVAGALVGGTSALVVGATIGSWARGRSRRHRALILTPEHVAFVGDPLGAQWAWRRELADASAHVAQGGGRAAGTTARLELAMRNGHVEEVLLPGAPPGQLRAWTAAIEAWLDGEGPDPS